MKQKILNKLVRKKINLYLHLSVFLERNTNNNNICLKNKLKNKWYFQKFLFRLYSIIYLYK